jgi:RNA polymerase sigma-70 factor, ECF subfamily
MDIPAQLEAIAGGSRAAFTQLYAAVLPKMQRYAAGLMAGDSGLAADAVDEAFMAIWRTAASYNGAGSAEGWIRHIVRNKVIDALRKQRERPLASDEAVRQLEAIADTADTPAETAEKNDAANELKAALERLTPDHREVIWLCYYEDKSVSQIAVIVGCPENTVKTRLFHARKQLKGMVSDTQSNQTPEMKCPK